MILSKKFDCTVEDLDSIVIALAKEIENGWHINSIEHHPLSLQIGVRMTEPMFTIELRRRDRYGL